MNMTNPNEKVWWMEDAYWFNDGAARFSKVASIVAEAERRTWEEAMQIIGDNKLFPTCCESKDCHMIDFEACIRAKIADKLAFLDKSPKQDL